VDRPAAGLSGWIVIVHAFQVREPPFAGSSWALTSQNRSMGTIGDNGERSELRLLVVAGRNVASMAIWM
jgi:hypothetical protein